ncbi:hypothetical protein [Usitatibacter palustris]|uniref:Uncharacterized protein n=1 Tax=Usitatibacter palustris TaxID=2732487 RepID=A0A6M4H670_9PROT|nr:hypothetical protein [Usitatibacter palustris]QJR15126.1 hypothetical protein DSM104440_01943 [Usitatibacter palustris]
MKTNRYFALAAAVCGALALPASADFVAKVMNLSNVEAKGMVQNHPPVMWLKRGQINDIRIGGKWRQEIKGPYTVNFENLGNAGHQYCVWKVEILPGYFNAEGNAVKESDLSRAWYVKLKTTLERSDPSFICETSGQFLGQVKSAQTKGTWNHLEKAMTPQPFRPAEDQGATINFALKSK